jgi:hypothetical protein
MASHNAKLDIVKTRLEYSPHIQYPLDFWRAIRPFLDLKG